MSALVYMLAKDKICIATDTLSVYPDNKKPFKFVTKAFLLPHLKAIICGTGCLNLISEWFIFVQNQVVAQDLYYLDKISPENLQKLYKKIEHHWGAVCSSTIYHFGYIEREEKFVGFAYRSEHDFKSEQLIYSLGVKPRYKEVVDIAIDEIKNKGLPDTFVEIIKKLKSIDDKLPVSERSGIGGEVHFFMLTQKEMFCCVCYRFEDYDQVFETMLELL